MAGIEQRTIGDGGRMFCYVSPSGEVLGSAFLSCVDGIWNLDLIQVNAAFRGRGIGSQLLQAIMADFRPGTGQFTPEFGNESLANFYRYNEITVSDSGALSWER